MIEIQQEITLTDEVQNKVGPTIIIDPEFEYIHPDREKISSLFARYGMNGSDIQRWTIVLKKSSEDSPSTDQLETLPKGKSPQKSYVDKKIYHWGKMTKRDRIIVIYPANILEDFFSSIPSIRQNIKDAEGQKLTRRQKARNAKKQEKIKNIPEKSESLEENAEHITMILNRLLYELVDDIFHQDTKENTRRALRASFLASRFVLVPALFSISPYLAIGSFAIFPLARVKLLRLVKKGQDVRTEKRIHQMLEEIPQSIILS